MEETERIRESREDVELQIWSGLITFISLISLMRSSRSFTGGTKPREDRDSGGASKSWSASSSSSSSSVCQSLSLLLFIITIVSRLY